MINICYWPAWGRSVQGKTVTEVFKPEVTVFYLYGPTLRACLHGGRGPQVGEVTRLGVVEKWPAFTCKLTTPGSRVTLLDVVANVT